MRIIASFTAALLFVFVLASSPSFAQDEKPDHPQDQQQKDKDTKSKPEAKQDEKARQDESKRNESRPEAKQDNARPENARPQEQARPEQRDGHAVRPQEPARPEQGGNARPVQAQRGQRIPDDKFRAHFGREHHFHVQRAEIVNQAQPQFVYGGYTFVLEQPWPATWSYDDDCYVDYLDGSYYLYDLNHPGIQILVFVTG